MSDLPLNRPTPRLEPDPPPQESSSILKWVLVALAGVAAGALLTFWWMSRSQPAPTPPPSAVADDSDVSSSRPRRQLIDLPALGQSDTLIRSLVSALSAHPTLARLLATDELVRGVTLAVVQIGDGRTPASPLESLRPATRTTMVGRETGPIDARSYERWAPAVAALTSVRPADAAQLYVNVKPLLDEAYIELGYSDGDFDAAIVRAIQTLAATPIPDRPPALIERAGYFDYADPALQGLKPVQKQFLLIGPTQQRAIMAWLRQFAEALDLDLP